MVANRLLQKSQRRVGENVVLHKNAHGAQARATVSNRLLQKSQRRVGENVVLYKNAHGAQARARVFECVFNLQPVSVYINKK